MQRIALLGSTGSIGGQTLDVVRAWPDLFSITTLTANNDWQLLARQAAEFRPDSAVIANREHYAALKEALAGLPVKVYAGADAVAQVVQGGEVDTVVNAIVGYAGLEPTAAAIAAGKKVALANKESLVVAGEVLMKMIAEGGRSAAGQGQNSQSCSPPLGAAADCGLAEQAPIIIPVDSEHSAIFQCLQGEAGPVRRLILTASGGPFLDVDDLSGVTVEQALRHPNWTMGRKITIDSATMVNKGFEVIEARWLFGVPASRIDVLVHPGSVVHSMVEFADGAVKAQLGTPDMHLPIQYALTWPERLPLDGPRLGFREPLTFREPDLKKFRGLALAYAALEMGGNAGCTLNAANEAAVAAFLAGRIRFVDIARVIEHTLETAPHVARITLDHCRAGHIEATRVAEEYIKKL